MSSKASKMEAALLTPSPLSVPIWPLVNNPAANLIRSLAVVAAAKKQDASAETTDFDNEFDGGGGNNTSSGRSDPLLPPPPPLPLPTLVRITWANERAARLRRIGACLRARTRLTSCLSLFLFQPLGGALSHLLKNPPDQESLQRLAAAVIASANMKVPPISLPGGAATGPLPFSPDLLWRYPNPFLPQPPPSPLESQLKAHLPGGLGHDPRTWTREDVAVFVRYCEREFDLDKIDMDKFQMNGEFACLCVTYVYKCFCHSADRVGSG